MTAWTRGDLIGKPGFTLKSGPGVAAIILLIVTASYLLSEVAGFIAKWPEAWTLPAAQWIGDGVTVALEWVKPVARVFSDLLGLSMQATNFLLTATPWGVIAALVIAAAWWCGRGRMAIAACGVVAFLVLSGYWLESMNTLSLVAVSVPLALMIGLSVGILAYETPKIRKVVEGILDVMQTVPTFAYLTPLLVLFGFGPVVGLIASAIYAAPPMARNVLLGLERVDPEIREAAAMAGATRRQRLLFVELPAASQQIMVGVNQCVMAALSMVIIAAVIGGFDDIGWEVLLTMRKAQFGQALLAGLVIVAFAILIDRMTGALAESQERGNAKVAGLIAVVGGVVLLALSMALPPIDQFAFFAPAASAVDQALGTFTADFGAALESIKNGAMFYLLLPLRIGLTQAVLPFTWGFSWTPEMSLWLFAIAILFAGVLAWRGKVVLGAALFFGVGLVHSGLTSLPWPIVIGGLAALGWRAGGWKLAAFCVGGLGVILLAGLWERAMLSLYLCGAAVLACAIVGGSLGLLAAVSQTAWRVLRPVCDALQTIPLFVFLIPVLMFFQIGEFSAFLAICAYAIVPMIRYTRQGLVTTPHDLIESAVSSGATKGQILFEIRAPYAAPTILLGLNQTILYAFAMLVIAALIGTTGLGQSIYIALGRADVGLGISAGVAMALLALIADRLVQAFAAERREALGL